ncbi:hypothetical protein [uncultured Microbacterium sp.]|uniref:hypothetical protein n=1 Tax=uncultured Microbacterium sp. TaxID=191216 RepID=UPI00262FFB57|nr:hypothetical protein [uncultured Microbacterium sp.]
MGDMHPGRFAGILATLPARLPISDWFGTNYPQRRGAWWGDRREHMVSWFDSQATRGAGAYTRRTPNLSARITYERLQAPGALLWIGEAAGAPAEAVQAAADAAVRATDNRTRCRVIREHLPWDMISEALNI